MCLSVVDSTPRPTKKERWVVKEFDVSSGDIYFPIRGGKAKRGVWLKAKGKRRIGFSGSYYKPGFHCLLKKGRYLTWGSTTLSVKVRMVVATGEQMQRNALVARELFIPLDKKKKK